MALIYSGDDPRAYPRHIPPREVPRLGGGQKAAHSRARTALRRKPLRVRRGPRPRGARYFAVQAFVVNADGYLGPTGHNYYLYEKDGLLAMLPWDYNLAFGTYSLGAPRPENDARAFVNCPIDEPAPLEILAKRPFFSVPFARGEGRVLYRKYLGEVAALFESGEFTAEITRAARMIAPYVERDPTAFCSYADHKLAVRTITAFCELRAESIRAQLNGEIPATRAGQAAAPETLVERLRDTHRGPRRDSRPYGLTRGAEKTKTHEKTREGRKILPRFP